MTRDYPTWAQKNSYLADALVAMNQVSADVEADTTNVWKSIDLTITALHLLREAAGSEQMSRHAAMVARMEAEEAARLARPTDPTPEVVAEVPEHLRDRIVELATYGRAGFLQAVSEVHAETGCGIAAAKATVTAVQQAAAEADYWSPEPMTQASREFMARQGVRR